MTGEGKTGIHECRALRVVVNEHVLGGGEGRGGRGGEGMGGVKRQVYEMSLSSHFAGGRFNPLLPAIWKVAVGHGKAVDDLYQL